VTFVLQQGYIFIEYKNDQTKKSESQYQGEIALRKAFEKI